jgi:hypothetical protein
VTRASGSVGRSKAASSTRARHPAFTATSARPTMARPSRHRRIHDHRRTRVAALRCYRQCHLPTALTRMTEGLRQLTEEEAAIRDPKWVSPTVVYLASEEAQDITGRVIQAGMGRIGVCEGWRRARRGRPGRRPCDGWLARARDDRKGAQELRDGWPGAGLRPVALMERASSPNVCKD